MVRCALGLVATLFAAGACDNGKRHLHPEAGRDAPPPPWWQPQHGTAKDWDIQLVDPIDVSATRTMYVLDLWGLVPAPTMLDYGDGDPVAVPMGANAGKIAELKGRGVKVICHINTGAIALTEPDARKFPGFEAMPPDRPTAPASGSVIGWSVDDDHLDTRYLDITTAGRARWTKYMFERFDLAKQIGCDGVDGAYNDSISEPPNSGFTISVSEQFSWYALVAKELHDRELSAGMRNGATVPDLIDTAADDFDWMIIERCGEYAECDKTRPFINKRRVVFAIDYDVDIDGNPTTEAVVCGRQTQAQISEGLIKDLALSKDKRVPCQP
jgi:hypothetical protein